MLPPELRERLQKKIEATSFEGRGSRGTEDSQQNVDRRPDAAWWKHKAAILADDCLVLLASIASLGFCALRWYHMSVASAVLAAALLWRVLPKRKAKLGVRVVCISDTHGCHRDLELPAGDVLVHAGDFTKFGKLEHAEDFNEWLGGLPFQHKIVVNGNHENNADWQPRIRQILSNATFLKAECITLNGLLFYGTDFCWPMKTESPLYAMIPDDADVVVAHGPAKGLSDGGMGCMALRWAMARVRPRAVISGHIHHAHGTSEGFGVLRGTTFVNAANCGKEGYRIGWGPIVIDL